MAMAWQGGLWGHGMAMEDHGMAVGDHHSVAMSWPRGTMVEPRHGHERPWHGHGTAKRAHGTAMARLWDMWLQGAMSLSRQDRAVATGTMAGSRHGHGSHQGHVTAMRANCCHQGHVLVTGAMA